MTNPDLRARSGIRSWIRRTGSVLLAAVKPTTGSELARLRATELALPTLHARPTVLVVHGLAPGLGASGLAALLAQAFNGLAPGRVGVFDADAVVQPLRVKLAAGADGDTRQMIGARAVWRIRRAVERYRAPDSLVALYAAGSGSQKPFSVPEAHSAVKVLGRRYPVLLVDVPINTSGELLRDLLGLADHAVVVTPPGSSVGGFRLWTEQLRPDLPVTAVTIGRSEDPSVDIALKDNRLYHRWGPTPLADAPLPVLRNIESLVTRLTTEWVPARHGTADMPGDALET